MYRFSFLLLCCAAGAQTLRLASPDGRVTLALETQPAPRISATLGGKAVLAPSTPGIVINGVNLAAGARAGALRRGKADAYCTPGAVPLRAKSAFELELRACNGGVAFRYRVPGTGRRAPDEATVFRPPAGSTVWYHDLEGHYEALHQQRAIGELAAGEWAAPPVTWRTAEGQYASVTEAALYRYAGMALQADGAGGLAARLGHTHPPSYPFRLRYKDDIERLARIATVDGPISTPWRVVIVGDDLNALVRSEMIRALAPPPDPALFPQGTKTTWIKPGRAVWRYLDGGENNAATVREFSRMAGELGFEYQVVEAFWQKWPAEELKSVVADSKSHGVGLILWKHSNQLRTPEARREFFDAVAAAGAAGVKIDFFDHEAKEVVEQYEILLREAAQRKLLVNFHGSNKPTGENYTWPNELTREGVRGMESRRSERARHDATLPFTRLLAGPADYTPVHFGERRNDTTWAHQIATAVAMTSGLLTYGAHPRSILDNPAVEMMKSIPAEWDETLVLPGSAIGTVAALARRRGETWFVAVLNGPAAGKLELRLSFLPAGKYRTLAVRDTGAASVSVEPGEASSASRYEESLLAGGGLVLRLTRLN
jgi:alpha-glucosidase